MHHFQFCGGFFAISLNVLKVHVRSVKIELNFELKHILFIDKTYPSFELQL